MVPVRGVLSHSCLRKANGDNGMVTGFGCLPGIADCGARRSICRVRETPRVSGSAVPPRQWLQASQLDQPVDRPRSFEYHHDPTTTQPSGYPPWLAAPTWHWCAARHEVRRVSFVTTHKLARPSSYACGGYIRTPSVSSGGHGH